MPSSTGGDFDPMGRVRLAPHVTIERSGAEFLALVGQQVVRVASPSAAVLAAVQQAAGETGSAPTSDTTIDAGELARAVDVLVDLGVLERVATPDSTPGPTPNAKGGVEPSPVPRRRALRAAAGAAALGVSVLVLPTAAAASSAPGNGGEDFVEGSEGDEPSPETTVPAGGDPEESEIDPETSDFTAGSVTLAASGTGGSTWTTVATAVGSSTDANSWDAVASRGNGVWVAVASSGSNRVLRSLDNGATWGQRPATRAHRWRTVAFGNGVWNAVASGTDDALPGERIMRSTNNGYSWGRRDATARHLWRSVAFGNPDPTAFPDGFWIAVASELAAFSGTNRVMRSTNNGRTWTNGIAAAAANEWRSVAYGNGVWVAVASTGSTSNNFSNNRVMRSTDNGASWTNTDISGVRAHAWQSVAYGNGVWVAVASNSAGSGSNQVMRSTDGGLTWTEHAAAEANEWRSVAYGNGVWVAVASNGTNRVMRSTNDGQTWAAVAAAAQNPWQSVAYGLGVWVAVATSGTNRVMRSSDGVA